MLHGKSPWLYHSSSSHSAPSLYCCSALIPQPAGDQSVTLPSSTIYKPMASTQTVSSLCQVQSRIISQVSCPSILPMSNVSTRKATLPQLSTVHSIIKPPWVRQRCLQLLKEKLSRSLHSRKPCLSFSLLKRPLSQPTTSALSEPNSQSTPFSALTTSRTSLSSAISAQGGGPLCSAF